MKKEGFKIQITVEDWDDYQKALAKLERRKNKNREAVRRFRQKEKKNVQPSNRKKNS